MTPSHRVVVVTGASGGIGRASALEFARRGDSVALVARGEAGLTAAVSEIEDLGGTAMAFPADVSDADAIEEAATAIEERLGPIDVWVNVAFSSIFAPFDKITANEFARATEVSYLGYVYGTMAALRRMKSRDRGTIVQVGSALAYRGIPLQSAYCGAKHAIQGFNESLRCELLHDHSPIRTTMVQMPAVNTTQFSWVLSRLPNRPQPVPPIYQPEVAARAVVWAAEHPQRREQWVGTSTAITVMANALVPGLLDRYLARTGYESQQTEQPRLPNQLANLWQQVDEYEDLGSHGSFDSRSIRRSPQLWASHHRNPLIVASFTIGLVSVLRAVAKRKSGR